MENLLILYLKTLASNPEVNDTEVKSLGRAKYYFWIETCPSREEVAKALALDEVHLSNHTGI